MTGCSSQPIDDQTSAAGQKELPKDVISVTRPLIGGQLYDEASFEGTTLTSFESSQELQILDTSDVIFTKVRVLKEEKEYTGFIPKAILPE
ncbi:hypothetical protein FVR03_09560 [Pontibacter qinzhouensis]|uniref:SH3 domain-containing protein n=1 Tax=Pontibacter qinzhouensis TaxID=2603253 RepID=A0A5C8KBC8_9BACT|nr:hypothetical protein [Pontibacter qinzhouensis]TXK47433.1 hypothetical protein FVR03_09560 [Pontibacter qinzhouensis]